MNGKKPLPDGVNRTGADFSGSGLLQTQDGCKSVAKGRLSVRRALYAGRPIKMQKVFRRLSGGEDVLDMATLLLIVIYIAFIGLGIPDSLFGAAWPAISREFGQPVSAAGSVTLLISGGTVVSSLLSARVINRFGTGAVTAFSTALTAAALLGFSLSGSIAWLWLFAVPLGLGAGAVDSALNNYVALHYKASHMSYLHCFYGVGVTLSPYLMSLALSQSGNWHTGYRAAFFIQAAIACVTLLSLPLWRRTKGDGAPEEEPRTLGFRALAGNPSVRTAWLVFFGSCAIEYTCGTWGSTFLVEAKGMEAGEAALLLTLYYAGMAIGRFLSGVLSARLASWTIIHGGQGLVLAAVLLLLLPLPASAAGAGLFLIGLGNGPVFPNLIHLTPKNFGRDVSQSVMGSQMAASYAGILLMPPLFGLLAQAAGAPLFPWFLLALFALMIGATWRLNRRLKQEGRY